MKPVKVSGKTDGTEGHEGIKNTGSSLCGRIQYEIYGPLKEVLNCHRSMCRELYASALSTRGKVKLLTGAPSEARNC